MFGIGASPTLAMVAGALWLLPESPEWLISHSRIDRARKVIASVTNEVRVDPLIERRQQRMEAGRPQQIGWRVLLVSRVRPALIVGLTLAAVQQFGGIDTIIFYAPTSIQETGLTASNSMIYSVPSASSTCSMTLVAIRLIDRMGRRRLLLVSLSGMLIMLALLGFSFVPI